MLVGAHGCDGNRTETQECELARAALPRTWHWRVIPSSSGGSAALVPGTLPVGLPRAACCPPCAPHQLAAVCAPAFPFSVASVPVLFQLVTTPLASVQLCRHFPAFFQFLGDQFLSPFLPSSDPIETWSGCVPTGGWWLFARVGCLTLLVGRGWGGQGTSVGSGGGRRQRAAP